MERWKGEGTRGGGESEKGGIVNREEKEVERRNMGRDKYGYEL